MYQQQHQYERRRRCPKCGAAPLLPVVYGFPSGPLLKGMLARRLVLGGDHLIENCHVWVCHQGCRASFRFYPYRDMQVWLRDDREQAERDAALRAGARKRGGGGEGGGGQWEEAEGGGGPGAGGLDVPRYTYEL
jgi:hypothetical protein